MDNTMTIGDVVLKVSPEQMFQTSSEIIKKASNVETMLEGVYSKIEKTSSYWQGSVGDLERKKMSSEKQNVAEIVHNINLYADKLKNMASNYADAESNAKTAAEELPTDIFD